MTRSTIAARIPGVQHSRRLGRTRQRQIQHRRDQQDLVPLLAERGIHLSREQVYRLVTQRPQRLSLDILAALCDILDCGVGDLIEVTAEPFEIRKTGSAMGKSTASAPKRTVVRRPENP